MTIALSLKNFHKISFLQKKSSSLPKKSLKLSLILCSLLSSTAPLTYAKADTSVEHPGVLDNSADFTQIQYKLSQHEQPWSDTFQSLRRSAYDRPNYIPHPIETVIRGTAPNHPKETYSALFRDAAAAYALALDWRLSGDTARGNAAALILTRWAHTLRYIGGTSDKYLASGIYGAQLAIAAETLRDFSGWSQNDQTALKDMLLHVFVPMNQEFLRDHNHSAIDHYWANWDLANLNALMAIGIYTDHPDLYQQAKDYFLHGRGNGALQNAAWKLYPNEGLAQWQESGRDQGHTLMGIGLAGTLCQMAWLQGDDLFSADNDRLLAAARYVAQYNLGNPVPYTTYTNSDVTQTTISPISRGQARPIWALYYGHYVLLLHKTAPEITQMYQLNPVEGGGGDYGPNSGGFDQLGYGSLTLLTAHHLNK